MLLPFIIIPILIKTEGSDSLKSYARLAAGGRIGILAMTVLCAVVWPLASIFSSKFDVIDAALIMVNLGSFWLPSVTATGVYGLLIVRGQEGERFFSRVGFLAHEGVARFLLGIYSRSAEIIRKSWLEGLFLVPLISLYTRGWFLMAAEGADLAPTVGLLVAIGIALSGFTSVHRLVRKENRSKLFTILASNAPPYPRGGLGSRIFAVFLVGLIVVVMWGV
jgi:hypothetical protein